MPSQVTEVLILTPLFSLSLSFLDWACARSISQDDQPNTQLKAPQLTPCGPSGGLPYLAHQSCSGMAPEWLGSVGCSRVRCQSAHSWNHQPDRMPLPQMSFSTPSHLPWGRHEAFMGAAGGGGKGNSCDECINYFVYSLHFPSLISVLLCRWHTLTEH